MDNYLNDMALFVEVVRAKGFRRAAEVTSVPSSTLSRRISELSDVAIRMGEPENSLLIARKLPHSPRDSMLLLITLNVLGLFNPHRNWKIMNAWG